MIHRAAPLIPAILILALLSFSIPAHAQPREDSIYTYRLHVKLEKAKSLITKGTAEIIDECNAVLRVKVNSVEDGEITLKIRVEQVKCKGSEIGLHEEEFEYQYPVAHSDPVDIDEPMLLSLYMDPQALEKGGRVSETGSGGGILPAYSYSVEAVYDVETGMLKHGRAALFVPLTGELVEVELTRAGIPYLLVLIFTVVIGAASAIIATVLVIKRGRQPRTINPPAPMPMEGQPASS